MATQQGKKLGLLLVAFFCFSEFAIAQPLERYSFAEPQLGTLIELTIYAVDETAANEAAQTAFARVKELDRIFSDYKPDSEAMRLSDQAGSGQPIKVSTELFYVLKQAITVSERTEGAFDVTIGPLVKLWRQARKEKKLPSPTEISHAKKLVDWRLVKLNEQDQTVELERVGMRLDFGGIAKGFIAQDVSNRLRDRGVNRALVIVAGDIVASDAPPSKDGWKIGVAPLEEGSRKPSRMVLLKNQAISTSGDAFQFVEIDGVRYSHILDPKTGLGLTQRSSVTIIADDGTIADAMATAVCVLGPDRGLPLIEKNSPPVMDAMIVQSTTKGVQTVETKTFESRLMK